MSTKPEPVAWRYVPGDVWGCAILTQDPKTANLAREFGREVEELFTAAQLAAAVAAERERCAKLCEGISDEYQRREGMKYPELKTDAQDGASECAAAIRQEPTR